jgi:hypothetical protein
MRYLSIRNLARYQHYKERRPPWVKLYQTVLEDVEFTCLQDASKWLAVGLLLVASRYDNRIPWDAKWIARAVHSSEEIDLQPLFDMGYLVEWVADSNASKDASNVLAERKQNARSKRTENREQNKTPAPRVSATSNGKYPHFPVPVSDTLHAAWLRLVGGVEYARLRKAFATLYPATGPLYPVADLESAIEAWAEQAKEEGGYAARNLKPEVFVADAVRWVEWVRTPNEIDGVPTAKGLKLLGAA